MGRRLTALRVREMELARQCTVQQSELHELRLNRIDLQEEAHQAQVEAAAEYARLERDRRELVGRYEQAVVRLELHDMLAMTMASQGASGGRTKREDAFYRSLSRARRAGVTVCWRGGGCGAARARGIHAITAAQDH